VVDAFRLCFVLLFEVALEFELGVGLALVDEDLRNQRIVIVFSVFAVGVDDLARGKVYGVRLVVVPVNFTRIFDVLSFSAVGVLLRFVVVETVGILGPGGDVDLDAG
jgi:hypothetical protein